MHAYIFHMNYVRLSKVYNKSERDKFRKTLHHYINSLRYCLSTEMEELTLKVPPEFII